MPRLSAACLTYLIASLATAGCGGGQARNYDTVSTDAGVRKRAVELDLRKALLEFRTQQGLDTLDQHEKLNEVARSHSEVMLQRQSLFHEGSDGTTPGKRVELAGFESGLVLENVSRGRDVLELTRQTLSAAGQRANLLNPDVTHLGLGVATRTDDYGTMIYATQVYVRLTPPIELSSAPKDLLRLINSGRRARGAVPLEEDGNLVNAATTALETFFKDDSLNQEATVGLGVGKLRDFAIAYEKLSGVMIVATTLREAARLEPTFNPVMKYAGIATIRGNRRDVAPNETAILILLASPRE